MSSQEAGSSVAVEAGAANSSVGHLQIEKVISQAAAAAKDKLGLW